MIIEIESSGAKSGNACTATFQLPRTTRHENVRVRLLDVTVPDPRFTDKFSAAITTDVDEFDVPAFRNLLELVDYLDGLVDSVSGARLLETWWDGISWEMWAFSKPINLSLEFRTRFKMPATLAVSQLEPTSLNIKTMDVSNGYVVELHVGEAEGFFKEDNTAIVATFPRGSNKPSNDYFFLTREPARTGTISVYSRRKSDGLLEEIYVADDERWSARIEVDVPQSKINPARF